MNLYTLSIVYLMFSKLWFEKNCSLLLFSLWIRNDNFGVYFCTIFSRILGINVKIHNYNDTNNSNNMCNYSSSSSSSYDCFTCGTKAISKEIDAKSMSFIGGKVGMGIQAFILGREANSLKCVFKWTDRVLKYVTWPDWVCKNGQPIAPLEPSTTLVRTILFLGFKAKLALTWRQEQSAWVQDIKPPYVMQSVIDDILQQCILLVEILECSCILVWYRLTAGNGEKIIVQYFHGVGRGAWR